MFQINAEAKLGFNLWGKKVLAAFWKQQMVCSPEIA